MTPFSANGIRDEFDDRMDAAKALFAETHPSPSATTPVSRDARGLVVVLLFGAYERLLTQLTIELITVAGSIRVGVRRLQPAFQAVATYDLLQGINGTSQRKAFALKAVPLMEKVSSVSPASAMNPAAFPNDGSFMKKSQVEVWCDFFQVPDPANLLVEIWPSLNAVVADRNAVAHGRETAGQVGARRSPNEVRALIDDWSRAWHRFLSEVENLASTRDFYRRPR